MFDIEKIEALAKAAGGGQWTASDSIVWFDDGDSAMQVMNPVPVFITHDNLGTWPDPIAAEDVATFAASVCPSAILELIAEVRSLREALSTPLLTGADAPMYGGIFGAYGINRGVAETAFYAGAPCVTVYYGVTRVFTSVAEFCAAHPKDHP